MKSEKLKSEEVKGQEIGQGTARTEAERLPRISPETDCASARRRRNRVPRGSNILFLLRKVLYLMVYFLSSFLYEVLSLLSSCSLRRPPIRVNGKRSADTPTFPAG